MVVEEELISRLRELAKKSCHPKFCHSAIIVDNKNNVVSVGRNFGNLPNDFESRKYRHAEAVALGKIPRHVDRSDLKLITARFRADETIGLGKPCKSCWYIIKYSGIGSVVFSGHDRFIEVKL